MKYPIPYGKKVLVQRKKTEVKKIILSHQEAVNQGVIVSIPEEDLKLKLGYEISFEYSIPSKLNYEDGFEYVLVPEVAILMIHNME